MEYRAQRIAIRLTDEEKHIIEKAADAASIQPAVYVRAMAIKAAKEQLK